MNSTISLPLRADSSAPVEKQIRYWKILEDGAAGRILRVLAPLALLNIAVGLYMALWYAPTERTMGDAQRIFYFHVPSAWVGFLAFFVVFIGSILFLLKRDPKWDALARSSAEIGVVFTTLVLLTGPLWAKAAWGTFWVWDARLTTTLVLWLIYIGYLMLRSAVDDTRRARMAAVLGIIGFMDVPIIYLSVTWWRTMHPTLLVGSEGGLERPMVITLMVCLLSFTLLYAWLMLVRVRLEEKRDQLAALQEREVA
ncbi:MAG: cytochrome c biogenesis protein CcsA [Anaerolineae bacterium]